MGMNARLIVRIFGAIWRVSADHRVDWWGTLVLSYIFSVGLFGNEYSKMVTNMPWLPEQPETGPRMSAFG